MRYTLSYSPSPLAFPNRAPGFNSSHPAALGCVLSLITAPGQARPINILAPSQTFSGVGTLTSVLFGGIGPAIKAAAFASLANGTAYYPQIIAHSCTWAAILQISSAFNGQPLFADAGSSATSFGVDCGMNASGDLVFVKNTGATPVTISSTVVMTLDTPYFVAMSCVDTVGVNFVAVNLTNGQTNSQFVADTTAITVASAGLYSVLGQNNNTTGSILIFAAEMFSPTVAATLPTLQAWAHDPWAFWYPRGGFDLIDDLGVIIAAAAAPALPNTWARAEY